MDPDATPAASPADPAAVDGAPPLVWDLPLRVFHWLLACAIAGSFVTHWLGVAAFEWHVRFGCATLVLVAFRVVWGFVGPRHARFAAFVRGPTAAYAYARSLATRSAAPVAGHNPLGGWMVLLLLVLALAQAASGLFANDQIVNAGPLYGYVSAEQSTTISRLHRRLSNLVLAAVALHVAAAFWYLLVRRENLIGAMISGRKRGLPAGEGIASQRIALACAIVLVLAAALGWLLATAPEYSLVMY